MNQPSAQIAIDTLQSLYEAVGPASVAYLFGPNVILTLSGVRGYCDGVFHSSNKATLETWQQEIASVMEALGVIADVCSYDVSKTNDPSDRSYVSYDLTLREGLEYSHTTTQLLTVSPDEITKQVRAKNLSKTVISNLKQGLATKQYSDEDCRYIATGLVLGYPDKAIIESIGQWWHQGDKFAPQMIQADIRGAGYYRCPQPVYFYPRSLVADSEITRHEALWSGILRGFYESDFHKSMAKQVEFQNKLHELGM